MLFVNLPIKSDVAIVAPVESCCNCGSTSNVKPKATDLRRMPLMGLAGAEIQVELPFPYCDTCAVTASRRPPAPLGIVALSCLVSLVLGMAWLFLGPQLSEDITLYIVAPVIVLASLALVWSFYRLRKASSGQTSYYQPVKLKNTGHKWPVDITGLELGFTNREYAAKFAAANHGAIAAKKLKVSAA